jgi:putative ABC transport system permease protein
VVGGTRFDLARWLPAKLDRKLLRDLWASKMQAIAIAFVVAAGVAVHIVAAGMLDSLQETRRAYYDRYRFADVWAPVVRAPERLHADIRDIPGVAAAETRVTSGVLFDIPGMDAPASGQAISLPDTGRPAVNHIHLSEGRLPRRGQREEAVLLDAFARAHGIGVDDTVSVTIHGGRERLRIVGIALSPEHVYAIAPGQIVPDPRLFGVVWMGRDALSQAVDRDGAFTEAVVTLEPGHPEAAVIDALDRLLAPYGAPGAYGRDQQISDAFISSEITQLDTMARVLPPIFLAVAAFLVNVVLTRLVAMERTEIGLLKAFGYHDRDVVLHYVKFAGAIGVIGLALGLGLGSWLGRQMAVMYTEYYHFPFLVFRLDAGVYTSAFLVTAVAVGGGGALAAWRAARLDPAVAMRAPPPPDYSKSIGAGLTRWKVIDRQTRMVFRQILRWPGRSAFTLLGVAISGGLLIGTMFFLDSVDVMIDVYFNDANRQDVSVTFVEPRSYEAFYAIERMPGVIAAEPVRQVAVRLRHGAAEERTGLTGVPRGAELSRLVDLDNNAVEAPPGALVMSRDLADKLGVEAGERIGIEVTEGRRPVFELPVSAVTTTLIGSGLQMEIGDLNRLLGEGRVISGASLRIDTDRRSTLYTRLKDTPGIAGVSLQTEAEESFIDLLDQSLGTSIFIYTGFAALIAIGVVYNSVRISFSEREHELAVLRVLGFTRGEVAYVLLGEIAVLTLLALPVGALLGTGLAWGFSQAMSSELFRLPFVISARTYGYAAGVVLVIAISSALMIRSRLDKLDMVAVLKSGE